MAAKLCFVRVGDIQGRLLQFDILEPFEPAMGRAGGVVVPQPRSMPSTALEHIATGMLRVHAMDLVGVTAALMTGTQTVEFVLFYLPDQPGLVCASDATTCAIKEALEV